MSGIANQCARCRRDFASLAAFDRHQDVNYKRTPAVVCREPEEAGLVPASHRRWGMPLSDERRLALSNLRA